MATPQVDSKIERIIKIVREVFGFDDFEHLLNGLVSEKYRKALDKGEQKFDMNFLPDPIVEKMLQDTAQTSFRGFSDDMTKALVRTMQEGIAENESQVMIKDRVQDFFSTKPNPTKFNWEARLNAILRTETNRAYNRGTAQAAEDSGIKGIIKWLDIVEDDRTSGICQAEHSKYGSREKAIPFEDNFVVTVDNKTYTKKQPPFHINCRTTLMTDTGDLNE